MIALAGKPVKTHTMETDYYYRVSLRGTSSLLPAPNLRGVEMSLAHRDCFG